MEVRLSCVDWWRKKKLVEFEGQSVEEDLDLCFSGRTEDKWSLWYPLGTSWLRLRLGIVLKFRLYRVKKRCVHAVG